MSGEARRRLDDAIEQYGCLSSDRGVVKGELIDLDEAIDWFILEVQAGLMCFRAWPNAENLALGGPLSWGCRFAGFVALCPSCTARAKLTEMLVTA